jgi:DNA-binding transcriptional LysR family regulator
MSLAHGSAIVPHYGRDLTVGPLIEERERVLAVGRNHRLAALESVSIEQLADETVQRPPHRVPRALLDTILPPFTPSGRPIPRTDFEVGSVPEMISLIVRGTIVAPTVRSVAIFAGDADLVLVPFSDLPPLPLGLVWCTAHSNARILAFAATVPTATCTDVRLGQHGSAGVTAV